MPKNKPLRQILAENLVAEMARNNLSQLKVAALAKRAGTPVDQTSVGRVMRGEFPATVDTLEAIANGVGIQPWRLFIPQGADENFLSLLKAWSVSSSTGRELLLLAADAAIKRDDERISAKGRA